MVSLSDICLRCYSYNHGKTEPCVNPIVVSCSNCYLMNYLTKGCCDLPNMDDNRYIKTFHLAGSPTPKFFIDVNIYGRSIAAMLNTNLSISRIDVAVLYHLQQKRPGRYNQNAGIVKVPMVVHHKPQLLDCEIRKLNGDIRIELGVNFLMGQYLLFRLNGHNIARRHGKPLETSHSRLLLDVVINDKLVSAIIDTSLVQSILHPNALNKQPENITMSITTSVIWNTTSIAVNFKLDATLKNSTALLGMDFLMQSNFYFKLGRIEIETQGTWVATHQDMYEYVYNHSNGHRLRDLLAVLQRERKYNQPRHILNRPIAPPKEVYVYKCKKD